MCIWVWETGRKVRFPKTLSSFALNTHKLYILRHCIYIVFILQKNHNNPDVIFYCFPLLVFLELAYQGSTGKTCEKGTRKSFIRSMTTAICRIKVHVYIILILKKVKVQMYLSHHYGEISVNSQEIYNIMLLAIKSYLNDFKYVYITHKKLKRWKLYRKSTGFQTRKLIQCCKSIY